MTLDRISAALFDQPHFYHPRKAETFVRAFGPRITGTNVTIVNGAGGVDHTAFANGRPSAGALGDRLGRAYDQNNVRPFDFIDNVAVIPIEGTLVQKGSWIGASSGETSYQGLQTQIARADGRDEVKGVVFEVDSFGGMVNGAFETAAAIRKLSVKKPTIAILTDFAFSAAYLLACQCRQIIIPEFGGAGSIGVVTLHVDWSEALEADGIRVTIIHAGEHKVDGNPYEPLPEGVRAEWQARVEAMRERFAEAVGQGRGRRYTKADALKSEARSYGSAEAVQFGLADAVGDPQEAFAAFISEVNRRF